MWSNVISINKSREKEFDYLIKKVDTISELSSAVEISENRKYIYLAGLCDYAEQIRTRIEDIVVDIYLNYDKLNYYRKNVKVTKINHAVVALYSALTYLDYDFERAFIIKVLTEMSSYDLDGIFRFRLRTLRNSWSEVAEMCNQLFSIGADDDDIYNVISYISSTASDKKTTLFLYEDNGLHIKNLNTHKNIEIKNLYENSEYNIINAVVSTRASRLFIDNVDISKSLYKALRHVTHIKKS